MAPEGLCSEDALQELVSPRSDEQSDEVYQGRKPFLMAAGPGWNTRYIFGDTTDNESWNHESWPNQRGKGHVLLGVAPCCRFTTLMQCECSKNLCRNQIPEFVWFWDFMLHLGACFSLAFWRMKDMYSASSIPLKHQRKRSRYAASSCTSS